MLPLSQFGVASWDRETSLPDSFGLLCSKTQFWEEISASCKRWLVLFVAKNRLPLFVNLYSTQALWVYSVENSCQIMMNQDPKDMMNSLIHHLKVNTNVQSVFLAWENRCKRAADTDSVEAVFCGLYGKRGAYRTGDDNSLASKTSQKMFNFPEFRGLLLRVDYLTC